MGEVVYELYAFNPDGIETFRPKNHHAVADEAKQLAGEMLQDIHERIRTGMPTFCGACQHDFMAVFRSPAPALVHATL